MQAGKADVLEDVTVNTFDRHRLSLSASFGMVHPIFLFEKQVIKMAHFFVPFFKYHLIYKVAPVPVVSQHSHTDQWHSLLKIRLLQKTLCGTAFKDSLEALV